ncbi:hypothetical protein [Thioalkalivibrio denitrificans]|uniref:hypothetical protein n=1 Tax=Thioalkalivibrio denitrificans TaxID=108003 RepID=UPI0009857BA9|nr:hypothetical protein [Thioalkalivibrio denitrificans]
MPQPVDQVACRRCGAEFMPAADIAAMAETLARRGLTTDHLALCPACRAYEMGLTPMSPRLPDSVRRQ